MLDEVVKLSHGCLLVLIETRNNPALFNVDVFVQRLQRIIIIIHILVFFYIIQISLEMLIYH